MANTDKDILITPNSGSSTADPKIEYVGANSSGNDTITIETLYDGTKTTLSFEGSAGQLFSVVNDLSSDPIFSVNDVSGIPSIEVDSDGEVRLAEFSGNVGIGTSSPGKKLTVDGDIKVGNGDAFMSENVAGSTRSLIALGTDNILRIKGNDNEGSSNVISMIAGGNVGIGTTSPATKLDIDGSFRVSGASTFNGTVTLSSGGQIGSGIVVGGDWDFEGADYNILFDQSASALEWQDNAKATFGTGNDLQIHHNGTTSSITNATGNFYITNTADDKDIIFETDDGSGGITQYLTLDGSAANIKLHRNLTAYDNVQVQLGTGADLRLYHTPNNSYIHNDTGTLYIENDATDGDIIFRSDDGSGGNVEYFRLDGGDVVTKISKTMLHFDNVKASFGNSEDMRIKHDGSNGSIDNYTGDLLLRNNVDDKDIILQSDDGSGGLADYIRLDGSTGETKLFHYGTEKIKTTSTGAAVTGNLVISGDLTVNGTNTILNTTTLDVEDKNITLNKGSGDTSGSADGAGITIQDAVDASTDASLTWNATDDNFEISHGLDFGDNSKVRFGNSNDLSIYHNGANSFIDDSGTGNLYIRANNLWLQKYTGETFIKGVADAEVTLYHNNQPKLATTSTGIDVTGGADAIAKVTGTTTAARLDLATTTHHVFMQVIESDGRFRIYDQTAANEYLTISNAGNVGIGTDSPSAKLHIHNTATTSDGDGTATMTTSGQDSILLYGHGGTSGQTYGSITWLGGNRRRAMISAVAENTDTDLIGLAFYTQGTDGSGDYAESMRISRDGKVGIGTDSPSYSLSVDSGTSDWPGFFKSTDDKAGIIIQDNDTTAYFGAQSSKAFMGLGAGALNTNLIVDGSGNVGIGTTSPQYSLHILEGTTNGGALFIEDGTSWLRFVPSLGGSGFNPMATAGDIGIIFSTDNVSSTSNSNIGLLIAPHHSSAGGIKILENGRVGIGTATPDTTLDVTSSGVHGIIMNQDTGNSAASGRIFFKDSTRTNTILNVSGNLEFRTGASIGSSSGDIRLTIQGDGKLKIGTGGTAYRFPTADGSSGQVLQTDGSGNLTFAAAGGGTITSATNMSDNRVLTASGSTTINGETNLTFGASGNQLILTGSTSAPPIFRIDDYETGSTALGKYGELRHDSGTTSLTARNGSSNGVVNFKGFNGSAFTTYGGFDASGNFEIGTTDIIDSSRNLTNIGTISSGAIGVNANTASYWGQANSLVLDASGNTGLTIKSSTSGNGRLVFTDTASSTAGLNDGGQIHYQHSDDSLNLRTAGTTALTIDSSGNVGIGDVTPDAKLTVQGDVLARDEFRGEVVSYSSNQDAPYLIASTSGYTGATTNWNTYGFQHRFKTDSGGAPRVTIDTYLGEAFAVTNNNRVGIGTGAPARTTVINSSGTTTLQITNDTTGVTNTDGLQIKHYTSGATQIWNYENSYMAFGTNNTERARFLSGGAFLIGKTALGVNNTGLQFNGGLLAVTKDGGEALILNRKTTDGVVADFRKDNTTVGSIGTRVGDLLIGTGNTGLQFYDAGREIIPRHTDGSNIDAAVQLGSAGSRFTDLYLSDAIRGDVKFENNTGTTEYARFDSSGNFMVGKTAANSATQGVEARVSGQLFATSDSAKAMFLNRLTSDGEIIDFRKDGTTVGNIKSRSGDLIIHTGITGLRFNDSNDAIHPVILNGSVSDGATDLGLTNARFKDLYLSGVANFGSLSDGTITITGFVDEDNMSSNSATLVPTQQSVKAYVDSQISSAGGNGISFEDNEKAQFGDGNDLQIYHDGSNSNCIKYTTSDIYLRNEGDNDKIYIQATNSGTLANYLTIDGSSNDIKLNKNLHASDNVKAIFGAGSDLQIYHDGHSYIKDTGSGNLVFDTNGNGMFFKHGDETLFEAYADGAVNLRHNNSIKLQTTSTGIDVTGTVTSDGLTVDGATTLNNTSAIALTLQRSSGASSNVSIKYDGASQDFYTGIASASEDFVIGASSNLNGDNFLRVANNGDISFYEDTGTTAKLVWSASEESLRVPLSLYANSINAYPSEGYAAVYSTGAGGSAPFNEAGHLVLQARSSGALRDIIFATGNGATERMRLDSQGRLGLGTTSPSEALSVSGNAELGSANYLYLNNGGYDGAGTHAGIRWFSTGSAKRKSADIITARADSFARSDLLFRTQSGTANADPTEVMRVTHDNRVGIGTDSPTVKLEIQENTNSTDVKLRLRSFNSSSAGRSTYIAYDPDTRIMGFGEVGDEVNIDQNGNFGIGTTSPNAKLESYVSGNFSTTYNNFSGDGLYIQTNGTVADGEYTAGISFSRTAANNSRVAGIAGVQEGSDADVTGLAFFTHPSTGTSNALQESLRISAAGRLGIGTQSPRNNLDIVDSDGKFRLTSYGPYFHNLTDSSNERYIHSRADGKLSIGYVAIANLTGGTGGYATTTYDHITIDTSGQVGIGTTSPTAKLEVNGGIKASGGSYFNGSVSLNAGGQIGSGFIVSGDFDFEGADYNILFDQSASALEWQDNAKATFGTGNDLQIYHDGSNSYINDSGSGNLRIGGTQIDILNPDSNEFKARFITDGAVELYYDNAKKFETTSGGVAITGDLTIGGNSALTSADYDTNVCHLKTNVDAAVDQGSANEFTINFNLEEHNDSGTFSHSSGVVTVLTAGWYRIYANLVYQNSVSSQRNTVRAYVEKNGTEITSTATYDYDRGSSYGEFSNNKVETMLYLAANDTVGIGNYAQNEDGTITIESAECEFIVSSVSVQTTSTNADTVDSLHASSFLRSDANDTATGDITFSGTTTFTGTPSFSSLNLGGVTDDDSSFLTGTQRIVSDGYIATQALYNYSETGSSPAAIVFGNGSTYGSDQISLITGGVTALYLNTSGNATFAGDISLGDNKKVVFGTGSDFDAYYNGTNLRIEGTGDLQVGASTGFNISSGYGVGSQTYMEGDYTNGIKLYQGGYTKLQTVSAGVDVTGTLSATGDVVAYASSDERLKDNITVIDSALNKVKQIRGVEFDWNNKQDTYEGHDIGVIAQDVEQVAPELVKDRQDGYKAVDYPKLTALLIEAVKELELKVKELEDKLQQ